MADWVIRAIEAWGLAAVALLMALENIAPPIPSEVIMPLAGFHAGRERIGLIGVIVVGTLGSLAGSSAWYCLGRRWGRDNVRRFIERRGYWLTITPEELDRALKWISRHGHWAVLVGRLVPGLRTLISLPAGAAEMPLLRFLVFSAMGTALWTTLLAVAGHALGHRHDRVGDLIGPVSTAFTVVIAVVYLVRFHRQRTRAHRRSPAD